MFSIDDRETQRLEKQLKTFKKRALPFATKETLNRAAFNAQKGYKREAQKDLTLRNKFTLQSIRVEQAKGLNVRQQISIVGSTAPYMEDQEFGGHKTRKSREGVSIATSYSAGQGDDTRPRTKLPRKPNKLENIKLKTKKRTPKNNKQSLVFKVQDAVESGNRAIYHKFNNGTKGIFRVVGGRKKFKRGWPVGAKIKMVWDMTRPSVRIPKEPMLKPAHKKAASMLPRFYRDSLRFQIKRHNIF